MREESTENSPSTFEIVAAYERWAYGEGWSAGLDEGRRQGFDEGYRAGFDIGAGIGATRLQVALAVAFNGRLPYLLPWLQQLETLLPVRARLAQTPEEPADPTWLDLSELAP